VVVRVVESLVVARGRDSDAAIIVMDDLWSRLAGFPVNEGPRQTFLYARRRTRSCTCRCAFSSHPGSVPTSWFSSSPSTLHN